MAFMPVTSVFSIRIQWGVWYISDGELQDTSQYLVDTIHALLHVLSLPYNKGI